MRGYNGSVGAVERPDHRMIQFRGEDVFPRYFCIGLVSRMLDVKPSAIRFWLDEFHLDVKKNKNGNRQFTKNDVEQVAEIHRLLKVEKFTLEGAKVKFQEFVKGYRFEKPSVTPER